MDSSSIFGIVGLLFAFIFGWENFVRFCNLLFKSTTLTGEWTSYHLNNDQKDVELSKCKWNFSRTILRKIKVEITSEDKPNINYHGNVFYFTIGNIVNKKSYKEYTSIMFNPKLLYSIWLYGDSEEPKHGIASYPPGVPDVLCADYFILTKTPLRDKDATEKIIEGRKLWLADSRSYKKRRYSDF